MNIKKTFLKTIKFIISIPKYLLAGLIKTYQFFLSTDHSFWARPKKFRICTYQPSCSEFGRQAVLKHGVIQGSVMASKRVFDCNPLSHGGKDPVPEKFTLKRYQGKNAKPAF